MESAKQPLCQILRFSAFLEEPHQAHQLNSPSFRFMTESSRSRLLCLLPFLESLALTTRETKQTRLAKRNPLCDLTFGCASGGFFS